MPILTKKKKKEVEETKTTGGLQAASRTALAKPSVTTGLGRQLSPEEKIELSKKAAAGPGGSDPAVRAGLRQTIQQAEQEKQLGEQKAGVEKEIGGLGQKVKPTAQIGKVDPLVSGGIGALSIGAGVTAGAKLGAGTGTLIAPGVGTVVGAVGGAAVGGLGALAIKIGVEKRQVTKEAKTVFLNAQGNDDDLLRMASDPTIPVAEVVYQYNRNLANALLARDELERQTDGKINEALSNARDELIDVEEWLEVEARRRQEVEKALLNRGLTTQPVGAFTPPSQTEIPEGQVIQ